MKLLPALLVLPLLLSPVAGQDEGKAVRAFKKASRSSPKSARSIGERKAALALLGDHDSKAVAKVLVAAYDEVEKEAVALDELRMAHMVEYKALSATLARNNNRGSKEQVGRHKMLQKLFISERNRIDALRDLQFSVRGRLERLRKPESLEFALKAVIGKSKKQYSIGLQLTVARTAGACGVELLGALTRALSRAKKGPARLALLDGIGILGEVAKPSAKVVLKLLADKDPEINERAALALSRMLIPEAIEPMIGLMLRSEEGARKRRLAASLEVLTRQQFGTRASTWQNWWAQQKEKYLAGGMPLGGGAISEHEKQNRGNYYFGIPQEGKAIMYIIDSSGSMKALVKLKIKTEADGADAKVSRLEACKRELIRALGRLDGKARFNMIWYSTLPHIYRKSMSSAAKPTVKNAQDWVRKLKDKGSTNIHDSLQMAFQKIGRGSRDQAYTVKLDTIFLLTDGSPTRPDGKADSTEKIIKAVREWNPLKRVTIHCIGIGNGLNAPFLSQLAAENGGEFKRY